MGSCSTTVNTGGKITLAGEASGSVAGSATGSGSIAVDINAPVVKAGLNTNINAGIKTGADTGKGLGAGAGTIASVNAGAGFNAGGNSGVGAGAGINAQVTIEPSVMNIQPPVLNIQPHNTTNTNININTQVETQTIVNTEVIVETGMNMEASSNINFGGNGGYTQGSNFGALTTINVNLEEKFNENNNYGEEITAYKRLRPGDKGYHCEECADKDPGEPILHNGRDVNDSRIWDHHEFINLENNKQFFVQDIEIMGLPEAEAPELSVYSDQGDDVIEHDEAIGEDFFNDLGGDIDMDFNAGAGVNINVQIGINA